MDPKVRSVTIDAWQHLTVRFSHRLPTGDWIPQRFKLTASSGQVIPIVAVYPFKHRGDACAVYSLKVEHPFDYPQQAYTLEVDGFGSHQARVDHLLKDTEHFFDADVRLGADYVPSATTFAVFAPGATAVTVVLADSVDGIDGVRDHAMDSTGNGVWRARVEGEQAGKYYAFKIVGHGFDSAQEVVDPYAVCTQARHSRSLIVDLRKTDPPGFRQHTFRGVDSTVDAIIYEMHTRDLTIAENSGVNCKGKYLGLTEGDTHHPGKPELRTALSHIVELGVTHVQLMPLQDFDNDELPGDAYNWGYMPLHFNSPDGWYASDPMRASRISELKSVIHAMHQAGVGVILDVVYNHTAGGASFESLAPGYYFRLTPGGRFSNGSGCGNEFASEVPMARKFLLDSVIYWATEYKIDGFRFDLMGLTDLETMKQIRNALKKINPQIIVYGEPWTAGATPLKPTTDKHTIRGSGIGAFNDRFRDAIKGERDGGETGFIQSGAHVDGIVKGLMGAVHDWAQGPTDSINYFEAHDNLTCWDKLLQSAPGASDEEHRRMMRFASLILLTAQGVAFLHSGQEFCRTKGGNHNSYNAPDELNQIDWMRKAQFADVWEYTRGLVAVRKAHSAFRLQTREAVEQRVHFEKPPNAQSIVYSIDGADLEGERAVAMLVLLNGAGHDTEFSVPDGKWQVLADQLHCSPDGLRSVRGNVLLPAHSGMLLTAE